MNHHLNHQETSILLSDGQKYLLAALGGKRLNPKQRETIAKLEEEYGLKKLTEVIDWAADRGMAIGRAVPAIKTAIAKWGSQGSGAGKTIVIENPYDRASHRK